ncbi:unnamed protein product [Rotaria socialis]|uniref:Uncharacterized protein n=1 Tax=Rotaria socialis TaxID=392032 RepID=A0A821SEK3_9BILA|nr:unnamed protein product [Rotaria socialis]CAF4554593.1 unnamed protein product [Rotaria socialis]CAF4858256.1 unnamed protein product [Rotaria socialis]
MFLNCRIQSSYVPCTLNHNASSSPRRYLLLPCYPNSNDETRIDLLLTNIPIYQLNQQELKQRSIDGFHQPTSVKPINDHERRLFTLSLLWNVHKEILEFNFKRLMYLINQFAANRVHRFSTHSNQEYLHEDEYTIALEFYLQIDIDLFYMKTCSYRGAQPDIDVPKGLFYIHESQAQYSIIACQQRSCCLCYPSYRLTYRSYQPIIQFRPNRRHSFINGYRSILNCPVTCTTKNIIYVLTCPCNKFDYIGETSVSLANLLSCK